MLCLRDSDNLIPDTRMEAASPPRIPHSDSTTISDKPKCTSVIGTGTALPGNYVDQEQLSARLRELWERRYSRNCAGLTRFQGALGITGRHLALPIEEYIPARHLREVQRCPGCEWLRTRDCGCARGARARGLQPRDVDHLFFVYGHRNRSAEYRHPRDQRASGCARRLSAPRFSGSDALRERAGTARAADYIRAFPGEVAMLLSIELCSLTLQRRGSLDCEYYRIGTFRRRRRRDADRRGAYRPGVAGPQIVATRSLVFSNNRRHPRLGNRRQRIQDRPVVETYRPRSTSISSARLIHSSPSRISIARKSAIGLRTPAVPKVLETLESAHLPEQSARAVRGVRYSRSATCRRASIMSHPRRVDERRRARGRALSTDDHRDWAPVSQWSWS